MDCSHRVRRSSSETGAFASRDFDHVGNPELARHLLALNVPVPYAAYRAMQQQKTPVTVGNLTATNAEEVHLLAFLQDKAPAEGLPMRLWPSR